MKKLTLSIDENVISKAKDFAKRSRRSLSEIVESYLETITKKENIEADAELDEIYGIVNVENDFDDKEAIRSILIDKHS